MAGRHYARMASRVRLGVLCLLAIALIASSGPALMSAVQTNLAAICLGQQAVQGEGGAAPVGHSQVPNPQTSCSESLTQLQDAVRLDADSARAEFWIGHAYMMLEDYASSAMAFGRSADMQASSDVALLFAGIAFDRAGQRELALARWGHIHDSTRAITRLADRLAQQDRCAKAEAYYRLAIQQPPPGLEEAHLGLADCLYKQERFEEAAVEYQVALQLGLENPVVANRLGKLLVQLGHPREAIPWLALAVEWHLYPWYMIDRVKGYEAAGDLASAEYWLTETERQFPQSPEVFWEFGNYYYRHEQYREAVNHYQHSVILSPQGPYYFYSSLGLAYLAMECPGKAVEAFTQAVQRDTGSSLIMEWLKNAQSQKRIGPEECP